MKTVFLVLVIGFVSVAVLLICVLSIVTSTSQGARWLQGRSDKDNGVDEHGADPDTDRPT